MPQPKDDSPLSTPRLAVVAIGRNEGERLGRCLQSIRASRRDSLIVYVDSGSTDKSVQLARDHGAEVVELDLSTKFTAARARNAGWKRACEMEPTLSYVQFVDGDCEVVDSWLPRAVSFLEEETEFAVVCGRRRERFPEASVYNRLCDLEWDTPVGEADACGGDALMRVSSLIDAKGYNESLIAGEEPELCHRLRVSGHKVQRLDEEMTLHDAAMTQVNQWFLRCKRSGHATAEKAQMYGHEHGRPGVKNLLSNLVWGGAVPTALLMTAAATGPLTALAASTAAYGYLFTRSYQHERKRRPKSDARLFAAACVLGKLPEAAGAFNYWSLRVRGQQSSLIEYKQAGGAGSAN